jgi:tRNA-splicing ligase RtcB
MKLKISPKELRAIGYPESPVIPVAMNVRENHFKHHTKGEAFDILKAVLHSPKDYATHETQQPIAEKLLPKEDKEVPEISLNNTGIHFNIFGREQIEEGPMHQIYTASKLPVAVAGALMPMRIMVMVCLSVVCWQQRMR